MTLPTIASDSEPSIAQRAEVNSNPEYLRCVESLAQSTDMVVGEDIVAANGMNLLAKGSRVDQGTWEKLRRHSLSMPLETVLVAAETVDVVTLARDIDQLLLSESALAAVPNRTGDPLAWKAVIGGLHLPTPLGFRLKVMRQQKASMYQHALRLALLAHCIGLQLGWSSPQLADLLLAALCHDIGEMHTDPSILDSGNPIEADNLRFIHVHPITGYVILSQTADLPRHVAQAVLQHHERLDGSGYPHGIRDDRIHPIARVLAVAELYDVVLHRGGVKRLKVILSVEQAQFDPAAVNALRALLPSDHAGDPVMPDHAGLAMTEALTPRLLRLEALTRQWEALQPRLLAAPQAQALRFIGERALQIQIVAWRVGIAPGFFAMFRPEEADQQSIYELHFTLDEIDRMMAALALEIRRRVVADHPCRTDLLAFCAALADKASAQESAAREIDAAFATMTE